MNNFELTTKITQQAIQQYANVSQDPNPIHLDKAAAINAGLPDIVAYGMLTMALSAKLITSYLQEGWFVSSHEAKMLLPVFVNETIIIKLEKTTQQNTYKITGINQSDKKVLRGRIQLQKITHI